MRLIGVPIILLGVVLLSRPLFAQVEAPSELLLLQSRIAYTWADAGHRIIQLEGAVRIETDHAVMQADNAVIWLSADDALMPQQRVEIVLLGDARIEHNQAARTGEQLFVTTRVRGTIRLTAEQRRAEDRRETAVNAQAAALRMAARPAPDAPAPPRWAAEPDDVPAPPDVPRIDQPAPRLVHPGAPVHYAAGHLETVDTPEDRVALVLSGGVVLFQRRPNGDFIELQAQRAVLFTDLERLTDLVRGEPVEATAAYLEGDVRIVFTPEQPGRGDQRLAAEQVYYEFATDRAILTQVAVHMLDVPRQLPIVMRARQVRQLAVGEFDGDRIELSTSAFATPSYSVAARRAYVRQEETGDPRVGTRTVFRARHSTFNFYGVPVFYLPFVSGSLTERGSALRGVQFESSDRFGTGVATEWGLLETFGRTPPRELDLTYRLDYYTRRGAATGLNARYSGGFVTDTTREPWNFTGDLTSFFVYDNATDLLGRWRQEVEPPRKFRGRALWQHQHFFPGDWQVQLRAGYTSDQTFIEQWFRDEFYHGLPHDVSAYFKRQQDIEALTLLVSFQPNHLVTIADMLQEQFEVERLPEISYFRLGQKLPHSDRLTIYSANRFSRLRHRPTTATIEEQGFVPGIVMPGQPALGTTGVTTDPVYRVDLRQEVDFPFSAGHFRIVPYVVGRYTGYSDSPENDRLDRFYGGGGIRATTAFWKTHDQFRSELFDLHRLRHVIEPELHVYGGVESRHRHETFHFDESIDSIHDIRAMQLSLRQRWQTQRGGPGRWRSVDFLTLNVEGNLFGNQPDAPQLDPLAFRGLFFPSMPEASVPRESVNADAIWRVTDTTVLLADVHYSLEADRIATAAVGLAVRRDPRLTWFIGTRYIDLLNSNISTFSAEYELTRKYRVSFSQSYDFGEGANVATGATVVRRFDRFLGTFTAYHNATTDDTGFLLQLHPEGFGFGLTSAMIPGVFGR